MKVIPIQPPDGTGACSCGDPSCTRIGKHPIGDLAHRGVKEATSRLSTIDKWWTEYPEANIGIATGASRLVVLDIDPRNGGNESLAKLETEHGTLPKAVKCKTGGGGYHYMYRVTEDLPDILPKKIGPGLDLLSGNSYFIAPPSRHASGGQYIRLKGHVLGQDEPDPLPLVLRSRPAILPLDGGKLIPEGKRNIELFNLGCHLRGLGLEEREIRQALLSARERCAAGREPITDEEVSRIVDNCCRYPAGSLPQGTPAGFVRSDTIVTRSIRHHWPDFTALLKERRAKKYAPVPTGIVFLDQLLGGGEAGGGLPRGQLVVLAGVPGFGKSSLAADICRWLAAAGVPCLFCSLELSRDAVMARLVGLEEGKSWLKVLTGAVHSKLLARVGKRIRKWPLFVVEQQDVPNVDAIALHAEHIKEKCGTYPFVVVDYAQMLGDAYTGDNMRRTMDLVSMALTSLAKKIDMPVLAISSIPRSAYSLGRRGHSDYTDFLGAAKESGRLEFDAGVVLTLVRHRVADDKFDPRSQPGMVVLAKNRFGVPQGRVHISYDGVTGHFSELDQAKAPGSGTDGLRDEELDQLLLEAIAGDVLTTQDAVREKVGRSKTRVRERIKTLLEKGWVTKARPGKPYQLDPHVTKGPDGIWRWDAGEGNPSDES